MVDRLKRALSIDKIEILTPTTYNSTLDRYRPGWTSGGEFCNGMGIPPRLGHTIENWDAMLLYPPSGYIVLWELDIRGY